MPILKKKTRTGKLFLSLYAFDVSLGWFGGFFFMTDIFIMLMTQTNKHIREWCVYVFQFNIFLLKYRDININRKIIIFIFDFLLLAYSPLQITNNERVYWSEIKWKKKLFRLLVATDCCNTKSNVRHHKKKTCPWNISIMFCMIFPTPIQLKKKVDAYSKQQSMIWKYLRMHSSVLHNEINTFRLLLSVNAMIKVMFVMVIKKWNCEVSNDKRYIIVEWVKTIKK